MSNSSVRNSDGYSRKIKLLIELSLSWFEYTVQSGTFQIFGVRKEIKT